MTRTVKQRLKQKVIVLVLATVGLLGLYYTYNNKTQVTLPVSSHPPNTTRCCNITEDAATCNPWKCQWCTHTLNRESEKLEHSATEPRMFFLETSGSPTLAWRQACSVESAARANPNSKIQLYMVTSTINYTSPPLATLLEYNNVNIEPLDIPTYFNGTPFAPWLHCSRWKTGPYAISHLSDALRYLTLWKCGGYYFDLDVLFLRSVEGLRNFVALESGKHVGAGAIHLDYRHPIIEEIARRFVTNYRKYEWATNGPIIFNRVLLDMCKKHPQDITNCRGFRVLPFNSFYPVNWNYWRYFFEERRAATVLTLTKGSYAVHVWNKSSGNSTVDMTSEQPYVLLARQACPKVSKLGRFW